MGKPSGWSGLRNCKATHLWVDEAKAKVANGYQLRGRTSHATDFTGSGQDDSGQSKPEQQRYTNDASDIIRKLRSRRLEELQACLRMPELPGFQIGYGARPGKNIIMMQGANMKWEE